MQEKTSQRNLGRPVRPISDLNLQHTIVKSVESFGHKPDDIKKFIKKAQHIEYGLSAEVEFASIAAWLGRCKLAHGLDQRPFSSTPFKKQPQIPDLFMVTEHGGVQRKFLIEVKTGEKKELRFTKAYYDNLCEYASFLNLPLLIAWRMRPFPAWVLFDSSRMELKSSRLSMLFGDALKANLMGCCLGDYIVGLRAGSTFSLHLEIMGDKKPTADGFECAMTVRRAWWADSDGIEQAWPPNGLGSMLLSRASAKVDVSESFITQSWVVADTSMFAQDILCSIIGFNIADGERIHWRHLAEDLEAIITRDQLLTNLQSSFRVFVQWVGFQMPDICPAWLPDEWKNTKV